MTDNKQYKYINISPALDGLELLCTLISQISSNYEKYQEYSREAYNLLENTKSKYVSAKEYDDINDKLLYRQREIIMLFAEQQTDSFSYKSTRDLLVKKGYLKDDLSEDIKQLLNEFRDVRNLTFHNTYSKLIAGREAYEKSIPEELKGLVKVKPRVNPVVILKNTEYSTLVLSSLCVHTTKRINQFDKLLDAMKKDYQSIYSQVPISFENIDCGITKATVDYVIKEQVVEYESISSDAIQVAMAIQKGKYDGSQEKFDEVTYKKEKK